MLVELVAKLVEDGKKLLFLGLVEHSEHIGCCQGTTLGDFSGPAAALIGQRHFDGTAISFGFLALDQSALLELLQHLAQRLRTNAQKESQVFLVDALLHGQHGQNARLTTTTLSMMAAAFAMAVTMPVTVGMAATSGPVVMTLLALLLRCIAVMAMSATFPLAIVMMAVFAAARALAVDMPHDHARAYKFAQQLFIVDCHTSFLSSVINKLPYFMNCIIVRFLIIIRWNLRI